MKVVDASALIDFLSGAGNRPALASLLDDDLFAPDLLVAEVVHHFRYELLGGRLTEQQAAEAIDVFNDADIEYLPVSNLVHDVWNLRHNVSAYDGCYVALAQDLRCPLLTSDRRLANAPGLPISVIVAE
jgi:predicted nucleic acid-binding protein